MRFFVLILALLAISILGHVHDHKEGEEASEHADCSVVCLHKNKHLIESCEGEAVCINSKVKEIIGPCVNTCPDTCEKECVLNGIKAEDLDSEARKKEGHACIAKCH